MKHHFAPELNRQGLLLSGGRVARVRHNTPL